MTFNMKHQKSSTIYVDSIRLAIDEESTTTTTTFDKSTLNPSGSKSTSQDWVTCKCSVLTHWLDP